MGQQDIAAADIFQRLTQQPRIGIFIAGQLIAQKTCRSPAHMLITALLGRTLFDKYNRTLIIAGLALLVSSIGVVVLSRRPSGK